MFDRKSIPEGILEQEQERKRSTEFILSSESKKELIAPVPKATDTAGLLDMLRKSSISPVDPVATTLPPPEKTPSPSDGLQTNLLEALRSSVVVENLEEELVERVDAPTPPPAEEIQKPVAPPKRSKAVSEKLSSLISTPRRSNSRTTQPVVEKGKKPEKKSKPVQTRKPFFLDDTSEVPQLGDVLPEDDSDTTIMARPTPGIPSNKSTPKKSKSKRSTKKKEVSTSVKTPVNETTDSIKKVDIEPPPIPNQGGSSANLLEAPVPVRAVIPTSNARKYKISLGRGRGSIKQACSPKSTVSQMVALLLINRLLPQRMDLMGRINSCYRVLEKGVPCSGRRTLASLKSDQLMLGSVSSRMLTVTLRIHTEDNMIQFITPINWVVPVGSIIDHLVSWLRLPHTGWRLKVGEQVLDAHDTIFDVYEEGCDMVVELHRNVPKR